MARLFVALKLRLLVNGWRKETGRLIGFITALAVFGPLSVGVAIGLVVLGRTSTSAGPIAAGVAFAVALLWALYPLIAFGLDETLDPQRLAPFPLTRRQLSVGLLAASAVGLGPLFTLLVLTGAVLGLVRGPLSAVVGVAAVAVLFALCLTLSRAVGTATSGLLRSRRGRDLAVLVGTLAAVGVQGLNVGFQLLVREGDLAAVEGLAASIAWTPPALAVLAVQDAAQGSALPALLRLAAAAATVALLTWWWQWSLRRALVTPDASTQRVRHSAGPAWWERRLPGGRTGAVAARELRYAWRDPRRRAGWVMAPAMGVVFPLGFAVLGEDPALAAPASLVLMALFFGMQTINTVGLDGSALWLHVATTDSAREVRADLAGKNLAHAVVAVPVLVAAAAALSVLAGPGVALTALGAALSLLGCAVAAGNVAGVLAPIPMPERSGSPFANASGGRGLVAAAASLGVMLAAPVLCLPLLLLLPVTGSGWSFGLALLVMGPAYGVGLAWLSRQMAAASLYPRLPEVLLMLARAGV